MKVLASVLKILPFLMLADWACAQTPAQRELAAIQTDLNTEPEYQQGWTGQQVMEAMVRKHHRVQDNALAFYKKHPSDPLRWEAVGIMLRVAQWPGLFITGFKPEYAQMGSMENTIKDTAAEQAWHKNLNELTARMAVASDVPQSYAIAQSLQFDLIQHVRAARLDPKQGNLLALRYRIEDAAARFPEQSFSDSAQAFVKVMAATAPGVSTREIWEIFARSPNKWVAETARLYMGNGTIDLPAFVSVDGRKVDLAAMRGKVVLVDFWSTYCHPCLEEMPKLKDLYKRYQSKGFEIVGIAMQFPNERQKLLDFVAKNEMPWPEYFDGKRWQTEAAVRNNVTTNPTAYLIDQKGKVVAFGTLAMPLHGEAIEEKLKELLGG